MTIRGNSGKVKRWAEKSVQKNKKLLGIMEMCIEPQNLSVSKRLKVGL